MAKQVVKGTVKQVDASLDKPIDKDAPPTIYGSKLKPEFASAALNLSVDFLRQQQSEANKYLLWNKTTLLGSFTCALLYLVSKSTFPRGSKSVSGFFVQYAYMNTKELITAGIVIVISSSVIFTLLSRVTENVFSKKIDAIVKTEGESVFDVNLNKLSADKVKGSEVLENTQIIVYRDTPIALAAIMENKHLSTEDSLVMGVTTIGARRVYLKSGVMEDLIDWALLRTKDLQYRKHGNGKSMKLLLDVCSFDKDLRDALKKKGFSPIKTFKYEESRVLNSLYGIRRELWGVQFRFEAHKKE
ncbi:LAMI_0G14576g1_1 [Lachancea mirantina]|uniref:LAMI_0G14576g1_1 n=1 Tax=Lachancea mirantina TaxID=1230905 RepID=A0A1G4KC54_9SACH|nr:LAMI_0G14576g1_1 [Lachancea mirantina]